MDEENLTEKGIFEQRLREIKRDPYKPLGKEHATESQLPSAKALSMIREVMELAQVI